MEYGICLLPVIPLRKEPNDRSEMLTQILFGETARIFDSKHKWLSVETDLDGYPGWLDEKQLEIISQEAYTTIINSEITLTLEPLTSAKNQSGDILLLPACSSLPGLHDNYFKAGSGEYHISGPSRLFAPGQANGLMETARNFLNVPYLWGGRTHLGMDCSGFTQAVYRLHGINIPRDASQQASSGETINFLSEAQPGDLAFFDDNEAKIIHVGMIIDPHTIIHASGKVRIDTLDHQGIFREESKGYSHQLRLVRRIIQ